MAITNGYCTLSELKHALETAASYTAATLSFTASTKTIADSVRGLRRFPTGALLLLSGSASNNGYKTVATGDVAAAIVTTEALVDEAAGASVTITDVTDLDDDARLEQIVTAVSRAIDKDCRRRFYAATETRTFAAVLPDLCLVDDLLSVTTLKTDNDGDRTYDETWVAADYDLLPSNAALDGEPYRRLEPTPRGSRRFPTHAKGVEIAGSWGYASSAPPAIREACLLWSLRVFERRHAIFGVKGSTQLGEVYLKLPPPDPDVAALLRPFRRVMV
jgi:hypothetical protein